ncbi:glycosyltransferase family 39 protein [Thalassotalea sp. G20_0]|uniref:ArnT family glycosyltransferase n=1 Tax=Thalassotalea sp. G20_0 TaxID=2821093 RepID=UPI001ADC4CAA|nr:glycosyltransferase family 39 protein [Thalassotalea sp. G20_0]MBO9493582.1 glycosyltransferase family 39 protein [Thalassotalea sp. G20_0]
MKKPSSLIIGSNGYEEKYIYLFAVIASSLLSVYLICQDDLINPDGYLYLELAQEYLKSGTFSAFSIYGWPFYSIITALFHWLTHIPLELSFYIFSVVSDAVVVFYFLRILSLLSNDKRAVLCGAIILLCAAVFNNYRDMVIRDHGFWAFMMAGFFYLLVSIRDKSPKFFLIALLCSVLATFFRVEGVVFIASYFLFFIAAHLKGISLRNQILWVLIPCSLLVTAFIIGFLLFSSSKLVQDVYLYLDVSSLITGLLSGAGLIKEQFLPEYGDDYSVLFVVAGLLSILFVEVLGAIGKFYLLLLLLHVKPVIEWYRNNSVILMMTFVSIIPLAAFVLVKYFVVTRYVFYTSLLMLIPLVCVISETFSFKRNRLKSSVVAFLIFASFIDSVVSFNKTEKVFFKDAAYWASANLASCGTIGTNHKILNYLINGSYAQTIFYGNNGTEDSIDYLVYYAKRKSGDLTRLENNGWLMLNSFVNNKSDHIYVLGKDSGDCKEKRQ